jgi:hypothetical protein
MAGQDFKSKWRMKSGTVEEVEAWVNHNWDDYVMQNFTLQVVNDSIRVTVIAILKSEVEKSMRMMQFAQNAMSGPPRRM